MGKGFIQSIRVVSYLALPIGAYLATGAPGIPPLTIILVNGGFLSEIAAISVLILIPCFIIIFVRKQQENETPINGDAASQMIPTGIIHMPSHKNLRKDLLTIASLVFLGLVPIILFIVFLIVLFSAAGG